MYLNIFHVDTSLAPSQHPYLTLTPPSLALIIFKIHIHVPKYISCGHIPCTLTTPILHPHTPTSPSFYFTNTNRLYIFYLQIYICLESVGYGAKGSMSLMICRGHIRASKGTFQIFLWLTVLWQIDILVQFCTLVFISSRI